MGKVTLGFIVLTALLIGMGAGYALIGLALVYGYVVVTWLSVEREDPSRDKTMSILRETSNFYHEASAALRADWNRMIGRPQEADPIYAFDPKGSK